MLVLILGPVLVQHVTIPKMVIKAASLPQGFLLLPVFCLQEFESREDCRRAAPSLSIKTCFPRQIGDCTPKEGEQSRPVLGVLLCNINCSGPLWLVWEEMEHTEVEENVLRKTVKSGAALCLGGSYCSFTVIFFCKVLNCKKLIFCSVN